MQLQIDKLGKVSITIEESYWDINKDYDKLTVVEKEGTFGTYISRKIVPAGTMLTDRTYWIPFSSLKEDIVLDYNAFISKYGEELSLVKEHISEIDEQIKIFNKLNENANEAISAANKAINAATTAIDSAKDALAEAEQIIDTNKKYTEKLDKIGNDVEIGDNAKIGSSSTINNNIFIGNNANIGENSVIERNVFMGQNSQIEQNVQVGTNTTIVENTNIASATYIDDDGLRIKDKHIIGRDSQDVINIGSDASGCCIRFSKSYQHPIVISDSKYDSKLQLCTGIDVVLGSRYDEPAPENSISIGTNTHIGTNIHIGDNLYIQNNVSIGEHVIIKDNLAINSGNNTFITLSTDYNTNKIYLGQNAVLGTKVKLYMSDDTNVLTYITDKVNTIATTDDVDKRINDIVAGAPEAFDTLKEISDKLQDNDDVVAGIMTTLGNKADKTSLSNITGKDSEVSANAIEILKDGVTKYPITDKCCIKNQDESVVFGTNPIHISGNVNIGNYVNIGEDINIGSYTYIAPNVNIGNNVDISSNVDISTSITTGTHIVNIGSGITIGTDTNISNSVILRRNVSISTDTYIGGKLTITDSGNLSINTKDNNAAIYIGSNTSIGNNIGIGDNIYINNGVSIGSNIKIQNLPGDNVSSGIKIKNNTYSITYNIGTGIEVKNEIDNTIAILIGTNVTIGSSTTIGSNTNIGINTNIGNNVDIKSGIIIREGIKIQPNVTIGTNTIIGEDVLIEKGIQFYTLGTYLMVKVNGTSYGIVLNTIS